MKVFNFHNPKTNKMVYATSLDEAVEILVPLRCEPYEMEEILDSKLRMLVIIYPDLLGSIRAGDLGEEAQSALALSDASSELLYAAMLHFNS
tara:strand:- start:52 stop:327 length:276 start_codon:yes stop_codon:yes gene_type:complete